MEKNTITKIITLTNKIKELTQDKTALDLLNEINTILTMEILNKEDKPKANKIKTITQYLKKVDNARPILQMIQNKNGTQSICDGYTAFVFKNHITELETLPNASDDESFNTQQVIDKTANYEHITLDELTILNNLDKFITLQKSKENYTKYSTITIYFNNKVFNAEFLLTATKILGNTIDDISLYELTHTENANSPLQIRTSEIESVILPMRANDKELENKTIEATNEFLKMLENN